MWERLQQVLRFDLIVLFRIEGPKYDSIRFALNGWVYSVDTTLSGTEEIKVKLRLVI